MPVGSSIAMEQQAEVGNTYSLGFMHQDEPISIDIEVNPLKNSSIREIREMYPHEFIIRACMKRSNTPEEQSRVAFCVGACNSNKKAGSITGIVVRGSDRNRGYGTSFLRAICAFLTGNGYAHKVHALVSSHNEAEKKMYRNAGFVFNSSCDACEPCREMVCEQ
jgi:ribosomal protein S18 acetylase RimI-like enzyme